MPSGGARTRSGPAPDPGSLRQLGKASEWTDLPASHDLEVPAWPADPTASPRELVLWRRHWEKPQAVLWVRNGLHDEVAQYIRLMAVVETGGASVAAGALAKQLRDMLLLSIPAMYSAKVRITADETATRRAAATPTAPAPRASLEVVPDASGQ